MRFGLIMLAVAGMTACTAQPISPELAADQCEARARAAQAPTGGVTFGVNNKTGAYTTAEIGVTGDFLTGADPEAVYDRCVLEKTGTTAIRRPVLR